MLRVRKGSGFSAGNGAYVSAFLMALEITYLDLGGNQERESSDQQTQPLSPLCPPSRQTLSPLGIALRLH